MRKSYSRFWQIGCGIALTAGVAGASPVLNVTPLGSVTSDGYGDTASGYSAFLVTAVADPGDVIGTIVAGGTTGSTQGFFGPFLQEWDVAARGGAVTPTPYETISDSTGPEDFYTLDTHFVINPANTTAVAAEAEDNTYSTHPAGAPADSSYDDWGTGSYLDGTFGLSNAYRVNSVAVAYIVLPTNQSATYNVGLVEDNSSTLLPVGGQVNVSGTINGTPEPASFGLLGGLAAIGFVRRRRTS